MLLYFSCLLGYKGPKMLILSFKLLIALINLFVIDKKLVEKLNIRRIVKITNFIFSFIFSRLGLIPKHDRSLQRIYYLSYLSEKFIIDSIINNAFALSYTSIQKIFTKILAVEKHAILIKWDVKDVFYNILIT